MRTPRKKKAQSPDYFSNPDFLLFSCTCLIAVFYVASVIIFWRGPALLASVLAALSVVALAIGREKIRDLALYVFIAVLGAGSEALCIYFGIWKYAAPGTVAGIPFWLPLVWGMGALFIKRSAVFVSLLKEWLA